MIHDGHKQRLRERALKDFDTLAQHEILELLLNFGIVRKNTNPLAHNLLLKYGSLSNVMNADLSSLLKVDGLGEVGATLLTLIPKLCNAYSKSRCAAYSKITNTAEAGEYCRNLLNFLNNEVVYAICLDKYDTIIDSVKVATGTVDFISITPQQLVKQILIHNPHHIYISHNHPKGPVFPSDSDILFTNELMKVLIPFNIELKDHIIISNDSYFSMSTIDEFQKIKTNLEINFKKHN